MKTNIKSAVAAIAFVGMSLGAASPALAQNVGPAGCNMPEASLCYWPQHPVEAMEAATPVLIEAVSYLGQPILNHPAVHVSAAAQIIKVAGVHNVPEAAMYLSAHVSQESGASQMLRVSGAGHVMVPEAALYLGEWMPRSAFPSE